MTVENTEATSAVENNQISTTALPDFLVGYQGETGTEDLKQYERVPFVRVVQGLGPLANEGFDPGTVIRMPSKEILFEKGQPFHVTPVYFFKEWGLWYHIKSGMANPVKE